MYLIVLCISIRRQRAKTRQLKLLAEIAESQKKFISQQNPDEGSMNLGNSQSLFNEQFSSEQSETAGAASSRSTCPKNTIEYECCVCRLTKTDSQSPIGLIGTSCLSLCKRNFKKISYLSYAFILVPSLEFAHLDENEQKVLSYDSNKITLETYLTITKRSLTQISGHPVK